jgi:hypothetical protein
MRVVCVRDKIGVDIVVLRRNMLVWRIVTRHNFDGADEMRCERNWSWGLCTPAGV